MLENHDPVAQTYPNFSKVLERHGDGFASLFESTALSFPFVAEQRSLFRCLSRGLVSFDPCIMHVNLLMKSFLQPFTVKYMC